MIVHEPAQPIQGCGAPACRRSRAWSAAQWRRRPCRTSLQRSAGTSVGGIRRLVPSASPLRARPVVRRRLAPSYTRREALRPPQCQQASCPSTNRRGRCKTLRRRYTRPCRNDARASLSRATGRAQSDRGDVDSYWSRPPSWPRRVHQQRLRRTARPAQSEDAYTGSMPLVRAAVTRHDSIRSRVPPHPSVRRCSQRYALNRS